MVDISKDYLYIDNLASGTYTTKAGVSYALSYIKVYPAIDAPNTMDDVGLPTVATKFGIWQDELPISPASNDNLVVNGESYRVIAFTRQTLISRWVITAMIDAGLHLT
jgi:hypothetical protein